jgi:hypothetical protein
VVKAYPTYRERERTSKTELLKTKVANVKYKKSLSLFVNEFRSAVAEYRLYDGKLSDDELCRIVLSALPKELYPIASMLRTEAIQANQDLVLETVLQALEIAGAQYLTENEVIEES